MEASTNAAVVSVFTDILSQDEGNRRVAEQQLAALEVLDDETVGTEIRQLAGVSLKLYVTTHWDDSIGSKFKPPKPSDATKAQVRAMLLHALNSPVRLVRTTAAHVITNIAQHDWPEEWPNLFHELCRVIDNVTNMVVREADGQGYGKDVIHGAFRVLANISGELSDLDIPQVAPVLMPTLVRVPIDKQHFGTSTRRDAVSIINTLVNTTLSTDDESVFHACVGSHLRPCINQLLTDLASDTHAISDASFESEVLQLLTTLCVDLHDFIDTQVDGGVPRLAGVLWKLLSRVTDSYVNVKIHPIRTNAMATALGEQAVLEDEMEELEGSDGETIEYESLIYAVLEFLSRLTSRKRYRCKLETYLPDVCNQLARLIQLPESMLHRWLSNVNEFLEDTEETLGCSVRLSALDVFKNFANVFPVFPTVLNRTIHQLISTAETKSVAIWWKPLEVALHLCASFPACLSIISDGATEQAMAKIYEHYLLPSLQQTDLPFLRITAMHCVSRLILSNPPLISHDEKLYNFLVTLLAPTQHAVVRASTVRMMADLSVRSLHTMLQRLGPECTGEEQQLKQQHLSSLVSSVIECLSSLGEPILDNGLYALLNLLRIDPRVFTLSVHAQVTAVLLELFKHCISVASTLSTYLDVVRALQATENASANEALEQAFMPTLLACLEQQDSVDAIAVEIFLYEVLTIMRSGGYHVAPTDFINLANHTLDRFSSRDNQQRILQGALQLLRLLIHVPTSGEGNNNNSTSTVSTVLMQRVFPAVVNIAISTADSMVIADCCEVLRCYLAVGIDRVLEWRDDEGNNGIDYILHVTSRLLDPSGPVEWATAAGRLVSAILLRLKAEQLGENMDLLLRGTLARLSTLPLTEGIMDQETLDDSNRMALDHSDDIQLGSVAGARQSLLFVFIILCRLRPEAAIDFLATVPDLTGQPVVGKVFRLWCASQPFYYIEHEVRSSAMALANVLLSTIQTNDARLMHLTTDDEVIETTHEESEVADRTRSKQAEKQGRFLQIPLVVKLYKLLIRELARQLQESARLDGVEEIDVIADDDKDEKKQQQQEEAEDDVTSDDETGSIEMNGFGDGESDDDDGTEDAGVGNDDPIYSSDPIMLMDMKQHLCDLFRNLAQQPFYNEFSRYHTMTELTILRNAQVIQLD